jgi:hypothetical protein
MTTQKDIIIKQVLELNKSLASHEAALSDVMAAIERCRLADMALTEELIKFSGEMQVLLSDECAVDGENQGKDN